MDAPFPFPEMKIVFCDKSMQREFEEHGFVTTRFYDESELKMLEEAYKELHPVRVEGFYASTFSPDEDHRRKVDAIVRKAGQRRIQELFTNIKVLFGSFIVKGKGPASEMGIHQDMTLVDESEFTGINIWAPLQDLNEENGTICFLPGSHRLIPTFRGATIKGIYVDVKDDIYPHMTSLYLKAGEAVIFDQSIIHRSPPNNGDAPRIVTNIFFTHKSARLQVAWYDQAGKEIELFSMPEDFVYRYMKFGYDIYGRPALGGSMGKVSYSFPSLTSEMIRQKYGNK